MKTVTLVEAVKAITGKPKVTESEAMLFALNNYMELCLFHRHENNIIEQSKRLSRYRAVKVAELKTKYSKS